MRKQTAKQHTMIASYVQKDLAKRLKDLLPKQSVLSQSKETSLTGVVEDVSEHMTKRNSHLEESKQTVNQTLMESN